MRIPSGKTDQNIYFVAISSTDGQSRVTGLSSFTVYRSRNGGASTLYTTPTIAEISSANQPGEYALLIDEDTTIASTSDSEEYLVSISATGMNRVSRTIELYRYPVTSGRTLDVSAGGEAGLDWANIGSPTTAQNLSGTSTKALEPTVATRTLDVTATGAAGIDWGNLENPTTTNGLTGTTISSSQVVASVTGAVGSVSGSVGSVVGLTPSNLDATVSSRATPAQVNAEVVDALNVDTYAEPGQINPPATNTIVSKLSFLYKAWRNKSTQTDVRYQLYADDQATVDQAATTSDDGTTFTRGEVATGP